MSADSGDCQLVDPRGICFPGWQFAGDPRKFLISGFTAADYQSHAALPHGEVFPPACVQAAANARERNRRLTG
jgi:hypothetical protein